MQDLLTMISMRDRPQMLVRAARFGLDDYNRGLSLPRLLKSTGEMRCGAAIMRLLDLEDQCEEKRTSKAADYSIAEHIALLTALLGEARLLRAARDGTASASTPVAPASATHPSQRLIP